MGASVAAGVTWGRVSRLLVARPPRLRPRGPCTSSTKEAPRRGQSEALDGGESTEERASLGRLPDDHNLAPFPGERLGSVRSRVAWQNQERPARRLRRGLWGPLIPRATQRSRLVELALRPEPRPKARRPPTRLHARGDEPRQTVFDLQGQH